MQTFTTASTEHIKCFERIQVLKYKGLKLFISFHYQVKQGFNTEIGLTLFLLIKPKFCLSQQKSISM